MVDISHIDLTARNAGFQGLWEEGRRVCKLASAWKNLEELFENGLGTNEVESYEWNRISKREAKKGKRLFNAPVKGRKKGKRHV